MTASPTREHHMTVSTRKLFESDFYLALNTLIGSVPPSGGV